MKAVIPLSALSVTDLRNVITCPPSPFHFFCHIAVIPTGKYVLCIPPPSVLACTAPVPGNSHLTNGAITISICPNTAGTNGKINKCYSIGTNYRCMVKLQILRLLSVSVLEYSSVSLLKSFLKTPVGFSFFSFLFRSVAPEVAQMPVSAPLGC